MVIKRPPILLLRPLAFDERSGERTRGEKTWRDAVQIYCTVGKPVETRFRLKKIGPLVSNELIGRLFDISRIVGDSINWMLNELIVYNQTGIILSLLRAWKCVREMKRDWFFLSLFLFLFLSLFFQAVVIWSGSKDIWRYDLRKVLSCRLWTRMKNFNDTRLFQDYYLRVKYLARDEIFQYVFFNFANDSLVRIFLFFLFFFLFLK